MGMSGVFSLPLSLSLCRLARQEVFLFVSPALFFADFSVLIPTTAWVLCRIGKVA